MVQLFGLTRIVFELDKVYISKLGAFKIGIYTHIGKEVPSTFIIELSVIQMKQYWRVMCLENNS